MPASVHFFGFALEECSDALPLDDLHHCVQSFPIGVERCIPHGRGIFLIYDLQNPAQVVLAAIDIDLDPGAVLDNFMVQRQHDDFRIGHDFSHAFVMNRPSEVQPAHLRTMPLAFGEPEGWHG